MSQPALLPINGGVVEQQYNHRPPLRNILDHPGFFAPKIIPILKV